MQIEVRKKRTYVKTDAAALQAEAEAQAKREAEEQAKRDEAEEERKANTQQSILLQKRFEHWCENLTQEERTAILSPEKTHCLPEKIYLHRYFIEHVCPGQEKE